MYCSKVSRQSTKPSLEAGHQVLREDGFSDDKNNQKGFVNASYI